MVRSPGVTLALTVAALFGAILLAGCAGPDPAAPECTDPSDARCEVEGSGGPGAPAGPTPSERVGAAMAFDAGRGAMVLFGGSGGPTGFLGDTWERVGTQWTKRSPPAAPPARLGAAMAYDSIRRVIVLFGGQLAGGPTGDATFLADTWEWNGTAWTERHPPASPGARYFAAFAFDESRKATVLWGGSDRGHTAFSDVYEWDGTQWTSYPPSSDSPTPRADMAFAYDSARGVCVLFSGNDGAFPDDTWERHETTWAKRSPATSPPGRGGHTAAFDRARAVTVVFGGNAGQTSGAPTGQQLADTWEWDGTAWTQRQPARSPPGRTAHAMAFDMARNVTVVFGGFGGDATPRPLSDTWEWDGTQWSRA